MGKNHAARTIFTRLRPHYIHRFDVEQDNNFTQILTYVLVSRGDALLAYRRRHLQQGRQSFFKAPPVLVSAATARCRNRPGSL